MVRYSIKIDKDVLYQKKLYLGSMHIRNKTSCSARFQQRLYKSVEEAYANQCVLTLIDHI